MRWRMQQCKERRYIFIVHKDEQNSSFLMKQRVRAERYDVTFQNLEADLLLYIIFVIYFIYVIIYRGPIYVVYTSIK